MQLYVVLLALVAGRDSLRASILKPDESSPESSPGEVTVDGISAPLEDGVGEGRWGAQQSVDFKHSAVSVTMQCIVNLVAQYFVIHTVVISWRLYCDSSDFSTSRERTLEVLESAAKTVDFAPMLAALFFATRMRAHYLTMGDPESWGLPPPYARAGMYTATWALLVQTIVVLILPYVLEKPLVTPDGKPFLSQETSGVAKLFGVLRWTAAAALYGGAGCVAAGALLMEAPAKVWPDQPPVAASVAATLVLALQYLLVYCLAAAVETYEQFRGATYNTTRLSAVLDLGIATVRFAPMLAVLFLGVRMRALQLDPHHGVMPLWVEICFALCMYSVLAQTVLVMLVPLLFGTKVHLGALDDPTFEISSRVGFWSLTGSRFGLLFIMMGSVGAIMYAPWALVSADGPTPPVSVAMQCTLWLCVLFFSVTLFWIILLTVKQAGSCEAFVEGVLPLLAGARYAVAFCPMLAILYLGLRLRALQMTGGLGAPQLWAQRAMILGTVAVLLQLMVAISPLKDARSAWVRSFGVLAQSTVTLMLYGSALTCVVALFKISPETATGEGGLVPTALLH
jgi:hypothetical protein